MTLSSEMDNQREHAKRGRFLLGILCAWTPLLVTLPILIGFAGFSRQKATGVPAVAGGLADAFATFGILAALIFEIVAIALLVQTFSREHPARASVAVLSLGCSGLTIAILGLFLWLSFFQLPHS